MKAAYTQEVLRRAQRLASLEKAGHALLFQHSTII